MLTFYKGVIHEINVVAVYIGVCRTNAAIAAQLLVDTYNVSMVINAGTAGGMRGKANLFVTVIVTESAYHDMHKAILTQYHLVMLTVYFKIRRDITGVD